MPRSMAPLMRSQTIGPALTYVRERGGDPDAIVAHFGLPDTVEHDAEMIAPLAKIHEIYDSLECAAGDPFLGVNLARRWRRGAFGLLEFCCRSAPTFGAALERLTRYIALSNELVVLSTERRHDGVVIRHEIPGEPRCVGRHGNELFLSVLVFTSRAVTGLPVVPRRAWLAHPAPAEVATLHEVLGPNLEFNAGSNGLVLDAAVLEAPLLTADPALSAVLDVQAEQSLARTRPPQDLLGQVRAYIQDALTDGAPDLRNAARALATSPRSLQRRLKDSGTSFQDQVEAVRKELADAFVADPRMPLGEVAFRLGYADTTAFLRAFKRWTGTTPGRYRSRDESVVV